MEAVRKLTNNNGTRKLSIPKEFVEAIGIEVNEIVKVEVVNGKIVISKIRDDKSL